MKMFTKNLVYFALVFAAGAVLFRYGLSSSLESGHTGRIWIFAIAYFFYNFAAGWYFGKRDHESLPLFDIGFRFHFTSYLLFILISEGWFLLGFGSKYENIRMVHLMALYWGFMVVFHFVMFLLAKRRSIRGISKEELFE